MGFRTATEKPMARERSVVDFMRNPGIQTKVSSGNLERMDVTIYQKRRQDVNNIASGEDDAVTSLEVCSKRPEKAVNRRIKRPTEASTTR